nr:glycosyltransferase [Acidobacteriota bacterium]
MKAFGGRDAWPSSQREANGELSPIAPPPAHALRLAASRKALLAAVGGGGDVTFIRGTGNLEHELICAGTRQLLAGIPYREVPLDEAPRVSGRTALLAGSGAWCRSCHELLPAMLPLLDRRFERVVVLPSSFDLAVDGVREALSRTGALVFAREAESYGQIREVCRAELAHDGAFFFDFTPYRMAGSGVLNAFRTDTESARKVPLPPDNRDISASLGSLDEWLWTIARAAIVRTDRVQVMIAAALLGKEVEYLPAGGHEVTATAAYALADFHVRPDLRPEPPDRLHPPLSPSSRPVDEKPSLAAGLSEIRERLTERAQGSLRLLPESLLSGGGEPRVTLVVLSWNRLDRTLANLASIARSVRLPARLLLLDNNSDSRVRRQLREAVREHGFVRLIELDRNLGCTAARQLALSYAETEYVIFLDNDVEIFPGTVEHLVHCLDREPEVAAVGANVVLPDGRLQFCGGDYREENGVLLFELQGQGRRFDDPAIGATGACRWVPGTISA